MSDVRFEASDTCPDCAGAGTLDHRPCPGRCAGTGRVHIQVNASDMLATAADARADLIHKFMEGSK